MSPLPGAIAAIADRQGEMTARLIRWADINSGSSHGAGLEKMADALAEEFGRVFPTAKVQRIPLGPSSPSAISVRLRPDLPRQVLLSGHYDTVYDADHPFQKCAPLSAPLRGNERRVDRDIANVPASRPVLTGPGVADMKGGLVVLLESLRAFEAALSSGDEDHRLTFGWEVLLTPDEETGSVLSGPLLRQVAKRHELALIFEPARPNGDLVRARMGTGIFTATCHGRAAHAGRDSAAGRNAIVALAEFLVEVDGSAAILPGTLLNVGTIRGGGTINVVPDMAEADLNVRVASQSAEVAVRRVLDSAAAQINAREGYRLEISGQMNRPPKEVTPAEEQLFSVYRDCARPAGFEANWRDVAGGSDGNLLSAAGLPCLDGLGPIGDHLHSAQECVQLGSLVQRAQAAALFLLRLL